MTIRYLYDEQEEMKAWSAENAGYEGFSRFRSDAAYIGIEIDGTIRATIIYDTFTQHNCFMHIVTDGSRQWVTREFLARFFAYPFVQCGLARVTAAIPETNSGSLTLCKKLGFVREGIIRKAGGDHDYVLMGMLKDECAFIKGISL